MGVSISLQRSDESGHLWRMMMRLLKISPLGLMLASRTADASTQYTHVVSDVVSDSVIDWGLGIFIIIIGMFIAFVIYEGKKNGRFE